MKKFLSLVLMFSISLSSFASTGAVQGLEKVINEYEYSMTVEWNQKDADVRRQLNQKFAEEIKDIIVKNGVSREEVLGLLAKRIKSQEQLDALKLKVALLPKDLSADEQLTHLLQSLESGSQGASWNGSSTIVWQGLAVLFLGAMVLFVADMIQQGSCVEYGTELKEYCPDEGGSCQWRYPCVKRENESWFFN